MEQKTLIIPLNAATSQSRKYNQLWRRTDRIFAEKQIRTDLAHGLVRFFQNCYHQAEHNATEAALFLQNYAKLLNSIHALNDPAEIQKFEQKLQRWLHGIDQIYEDSNDDALYLDGQKKLFTVLFNYNKAVLMTREIEQRERDLYTNLDKQAA